MYFEKPTGVGIYTREVWNKLFQQLDRNNIEYKFFSYSKKNIGAEDKQCEVKLPFMLQLLFKRFISLHRLLWNIFYLPLISRKYNLVYSFSSHGSPFIKNQIITIHDLICFSFPQQHRFQYLYFKYILPHVIKSCEKIVVVSEFTKQEVIKHYKIDAGKIEVIYNGGDHLYFKNKHDFENEEELRKRINGKFFLTVGASYSHKNIERLLHAFQQSGVAEKLVIVGVDNDYYKHLQKIAARLKINNAVFLNYVSPAALSWLYDNCIANVYVSLYEGFGFPPLEAAIYNKISILSKSTALYEIYKNAALFVNPENIDDIRNALKRISSSQFDFTACLNNAALLINKYKWKITVDKIARLITEESACNKNKQTEILT